MKIEKDYIKDLLNRVEKTERSVFKISDIADQQEYLSEKFIQHMRILSEKSLVVCDAHNSMDIGINRLGNGAAIWGIKWLRLTSEGYDFLEAINNKTVWNKIKKELKAPSISTLMSTSKFLLQEAIKSQMRQ
ncbi:Hypothetical protein SAMN04488029_0156 [Reichenbachiella faecimaris]|uniref:DUF2513 domain-containing protein n=1 Tax=Reichenbachiella faecimaris TaxID=692418 RepID=A0A1W2G625_REIFA|nr:DUF2513 domain-containing protein [Reichenbachiella faecimaris]SMD31818.1 Hypothetical protein SAMN04488029_0156 [Reichenbachiella faecimaris]